MTTLVIGPGYTGSRVVSRLEDALVSGRSLAGDRHLGACRTIRQESST